MARRAATRADLLASRVVDTPLVRVDARPDAPRLHVVGHKRVRVAGGPAATQPAAAWPTSTSTWCWHCCHPFATPPLPLPTRYDDRLDVFHATGTFCSWACLKAFNAESKSSMQSICANVIALFHRRCTGRLGGLRAAPPRLALRAFGGHMSIEEFRAASRGDDPKEYVLMPPRLIAHHLVVHELDPKRSHARTASAKAAELQAVVTFKDVATKNETLRLKRPKPLQNNRNLLERTMGLGG